MKKFLLVLILLPVMLFAQEKYTVSICAIFNNEARFLKEWIDYHEKIGIEHFWLYNNNSEDDYESVLQPYIERNLVELTQWCRKYDDVCQFNAIQCGAYNDCILKAREKTEWLAVIDTDEFIVLYNSNLTEFLEEFDSEVGICINWQMYGTSNIWDCEGQMLKKLVWKGDTNLDVNRHVKTIVRPFFVSHYVNPHNAIYEYSVSVDENFNIVEYYQTQKVSINKIRINHYWCRDDKFMHEIKIPRRAKWNDYSIKENNKLYNKVYDPILSHSSS